MQQNRKRTEKQNSLKIAKNRQQSVNINGLNGSVTGHRMLNRKTKAKMFTVYGKLIYI